MSVRGRQPTSCGGTVLWRYAVDSRLSTGDEGAELFAALEASVCADADVEFAVAFDPGSRVRRPGRPISTSRSSSPAISPSATGSTSDVSCREVSSATTFPSSTAPTSRRSRSTSHFTSGGRHRRRDRDDARRRGRVQERSRARVRTHMLKKCTKRPKPDSECTTRTAAGSQRGFETERELTALASNPPTQPTRDPVRFLCPRPSSTPIGSCRQASGTWSHGLHTAPSRSTECIVRHRIGLRMTDPL